MEENETTSRPTVFSTGIKFGLILALASILFTLVLIVLGSNPYQSGWKGLISAAIAIAIVVFAHKNFKDNGDGFMTYGQGLGISIIAGLVSVFFSGLFSYLHITFIDPSSFEEVWKKAAEDMEAKGQSEEQIEMGLMWGRKLFWVIYFFVGAFSGLIIGLIVSIFTQNRKPEQTF